jgi:hypothetical protein
LSDITQNIKEFCMTLMTNQVKRALQLAPAYLDDLADNTDFPQDETTFRDTKHELNFNVQSVVDGFTASFEHAFDTLTGDGLYQEAQKGGVDTSVIKGVEDLEEKLSLETMISKAQSHTEVHLHNIVRQLNAIMGDDWIQHNKNPLDPQFLVLAWLDAMHVMQLQTKGNLAMFSLFDQYVLNQLPKVLEKIGLYLEEMHEQTEQAKKGTANNESGGATDAEQAFGDLDGQSGASQIDYNAEPPLERNTNELIQALDLMQANREFDNGDYYDNSNMLDARRLLLDSNATHEDKIDPWTIGQINDDVIDMTKLLFTYILEDSHLPEDIRRHIARLQIPYLKLGLLDKTLFTEKAHPARLLLNELSQSVSLWDPTHAGGIDLLLQETMHVIDAILDSFKQDANIFIDLQTNFSAFLAGKELVTAAMLKRKEKSSSKAAQTDDARTIIDHLLQDICDGKRIPPIIQRILEEHWSKVMFLEYLKSDGNSAEYQEYINTAKELVDSVQFKSSDEQRKAMGKSLPSLIKNVRNGLESISLSKFDSMELLKELQECHMLVLKEKAEDYQEADLEITQEAYDDFVQEQKTPVDWNREDLESALLEERIERSMNQPNVSIELLEQASANVSNDLDSQQESSEHDAQTEPTNNQHENPIDDDMQQAMDAYEKALEEHQSKKAQEPSESGNDADDFMMQFFQSPDANKKAEPAQAEEMAKAPAPNNNVITADDRTIDTRTNDDKDNDEIHEQLQQVTSLPQAPEPYQVEVNKEKANRPPIDDMPPSDIKREAVQDNDDEIAQRAAGAIEEESFRELDDDKVNELVERLKVGLWVDLVSEKDAKTRAKIMAIVPTVGKYIFGDRRGRKLADFNKESLSEALRTGQIRINEDENVFDKTLESVISNLRVMKKASDE